MIAVIAVIALQWHLAPFRVDAVLSRLLWRLVRRGGQVADRLMSEQFEQEREAVLAAARRAGQRVHWATVHDTSASTLLMVGLGEVRGDEDWLADQVRRDITALRSDLNPTTPRSTLPRS